MKFSLRTLLIFALLAGVLLGVLGLVIQRNLPSQRSAKFHDAIYFSDPAAVKSFVDEGIDLDADLGLNGGWTALQRAAACRDASVVEILVENGADVDATVSGNRTTPLHWAIQDGSPDIAEMLLIAGADPNQICDDWTALDSLFGHRYVGRLRTLSNKEFVRIERLLIEYGGTETLERSEADKEESRNSPNAN